MKQYKCERFIVSFTSFGDRFKFANMMVRNFLRQDYSNFHLVMTVYKDDVTKITPELKELIDNDILEVIIAPEDLGPHLKYYYVMEKYWDKPIVTIDDDRYYSQNLLARMVSKYDQIHYRSVISTCAPQLAKNEKGELQLRSQWCVPWTRLKPDEVSPLAMAEGFSGIIYPPCAFSNIFNPETIQEIKEHAKYDDDIYLKVLGIRNRLVVSQIHGYRETVQSDDIEESQNFSLADRGKPIDYRNEVTKYFEKDLLNAWSI